jgi:hypothetical protein
LVCRSLRVDISKAWCAESIDGVIIVWAGRAELLEINNRSFGSVNI